jgi:pilus assembly protein CpaE
MEVSIFSNDHAAAERLRSALTECDVLCPISRVHAIAPSASVSLSPPDEPEAVFVIVMEEDDSLSWLEESCSQGSTPVIAVGAARDPHFMLRVIQAGPADYVDIDGNLVDDLRRALGRIEKKRTQRTATGQLVSVFSHCGGSGCSFLAANLAVALSEMHEECLLCDFNVRRGDLATLLNLKPHFTINDLTTNLSKLQRELLDQVLTPHTTGVQLLAAPTSLSEVHPIPVEAISRILQLARERFAFSVADLEDFFHAEQYELLRQSETILFVLRLDYTSLRNARRTFEHLERDGIEPGRIRLVVNQYGRPRELTSRQAEEVLGRKPEFYVPFDPKPAISSVNRGEPLLLSYPKSRIARSIRQIASAVAAPQPAAAIL